MSNPTEFYSLSGSVAAADFVAFPTLTLIADDNAAQEFTVEYELLGLTMTSSLTNFGAGLMGVFLLIGTNTNKTTFAKTTPAPIGAITRQNSLSGPPATPIPSDKTVTKVFLQPVRIKSGSRIGLFAFGDTTAGNALSAFVNLEMRRAADQTGRPVETVDDARSSPLAFFRLTVIADPADAVGVIGGDVTFSAAFISNLPASTIVYGWEMFDPDPSSIGWKPVQEAAGFYEGTTTTTLHVKAIDNFLVSLAPLKFRCVALYALAVKTVTNWATLTVPKHANFTKQPGGVGVANFADPVTIPIAAAAVPVVTGMGSPLTYAWARIAGAAFICSDDTIANPSWINAAPGVGVNSSAWQCTISDGIDTITTDPIYLFAFRAQPGNTAVPATSTVPPVSLNGQFTTGANFAAPWSIYGQTSLRMDPAAPAILIGTPNAADTDFGVLAVIQGGQRVIGWPGFAALDGTNETLCLGTVDFAVATTP